MTETLSERLRAAALLDAHFAVPAERDELVLLLHDAAEDLDAICQRAETALVAGPQPSARAAVDAWMDVFVARSQYFEDTLTKANDKIRDLKRDCIDAGLALQGMRQDNETLRKMLVHAGEHATAVFAEWRAFLERAVCHPGPPLSETEGYDPDAPVGELEAAILERLDHETEDRRDLWDIRKRCEEALGRTPDPARKTMQVVLDLCAYAEAARTYRANMEDPPADLEAHERAFGWPVVRPEHFAGPFPAISGYVKRTREARAATIDQALRMLKDGQRLAVHDEPERVDILFLDPGQDPPLGQTWTIYGPLSAEYREAFNASLDRQRCAAAGGELRPAVATHMATLQANHVDRTSTPHPKAAEFQKLIDDLRGENQPVDDAPSPRADELDALIAGLRDKIGEDARNTPETRARILASVADFMASKEAAEPVPAVTLDEVNSDLPNGKVAFKVRVSPELAAAVERQREEDGAARLRRTMAEASAEHEGDDATRRMYRPMMEMYRPMMETRRRQTYRPGSPIPERAPADYHPAEYITPEQEAEAAEQAERFQGLDDSDRE